MLRVILGSIVGLVATVLVVVWRAEAAAWQAEAGREHAPLDAGAIPFAIYGKE